MPKFHERTGALHGDICVSAGIQARVLQDTASHYDPKHEPYGICWFVPQGSATQQPLPGSPEEASPNPAKQNEEPLLRHHEQAEEHLAAPSSGYATEQSVPSAETTMRTLSAEELPLRRHEEPEEHLAASSSGYATEPSVPNEATTMPTGDAAATEHSEETTELPAEKEMSYSIVNVFCNDITFHVPEAETFWWPC